ncbi:MAG TPA: hypothetical protein VMI33_17165 [Streptosporangiaceae bacterium]|nr:hypothetical protein [Streptosporangiaceae bacterium]
MTAVPRPPERREPRAIVHTGRGGRPEPFDVHGDQIRLDEIETSCPGCTLEWSGGGWQHDPACAARGVRLRLA